MRRSILAVVLVLAGTLGAAAAGVGPSAADGNEAPGAPIVARSVSSGTSHSCARLATGAVKCWGANASGQLGLGDTATRGDQPGEMGVDLVTVDLGTGRTATAVAVGNNHSCAVLDDGTVKCWGINGTGQLGLGDTTPRGDQPGEMGDALPTVDLGTGRTALALTAGTAHTCALLDDHSVKCWGSAVYGQIGSGDGNHRGDQPGEMGNALAPISLGTGRTATAITAGDNFTCALLDNATVKCWGRNDNGQLADGGTATRGTLPGQMGNAMPAVNLGTGRTATAISAGAEHVCALLDNATVKCWGDNQFGQLGQGNTTDRGDFANVGHEMGDALPPVALGTGRTATAVTGGGSHSCARLDDATVKCWGRNDTGQLGLGSTATVGDQPGEMGDALLTVSLGAGHGSLGVTAGALFTCAIRDDAQLRCWGRNALGQLGVGDVVQRGDAPGELGDGAPSTRLTGSGVTGRVDAAGGGALPASLVALLDPDDYSVVGGSVAISDGRFGVDAPPGQYLVYGIDPSGSASPGFAGSPSLITVTADATTTADLVLPARTGSIAGTIVQHGNDAPLAGIVVVAIDLVAGAPERAVATAADGSYQLDGLRPGPHLVLFLDLGGGHPPRYFPSASSPAAATPVDVTAGETTTADATVPAQAGLGAGAALTGRVTDDVTGAPVAGGLALALRASDLAFARGALTNETGGYAMTVPPGDYHLVFLDPSGDHAGEWFLDRPIGDPGAADALAAPGAANVGLHPSTGAMSGGVTGSSGPPLPGTWVIAVRANGVAGAAVADDTGAYRLDHLPVDNYRAVFLEPHSGAYTYWQSATDFAGASVFVVTGGGDTPIDAVLVDP